MEKKGRQIFSKIVPASKAKSTADKQRSPSLWPLLTALEEATKKLSDSR